MRRRFPFSGSGFGIIPTDVTARFRAAEANSLQLRRGGPDQSAPTDSSGPSLLDRGAAAAAFFTNFGGRSAAAPSAPLYQLSAPWIDPPDGLQAFYSPAGMGAVTATNGIIATPNAPSSDTVTFVFTVPNGWDGVIKQIANWYSGNYVQGSGSLVWRLLRNGQPFKNFDAVTWTIGSPAAPFDFGRAGLMLKSGDVISGIVNNASAVAPGTFTAWYLGGYLYPRSGS